MDICRLLGSLSRPVAGNRCNEALCWCFLSRCTLFYQERYDQPDLFYTYNIILGLISFVQPLNLSNQLRFHGTAAHDASFLKRNEGDMNACDYSGPWSALKLAPEKKKQNEGAISLNG